MNHIDNLSGCGYLDSLPVIGRSMVIAVKTGEKEKHRDFLGDE